MKMGASCWGRPVKRNGSGEGNSGRTGKVLKLKRATPVQTLKNEEARLTQQEKKRGE